MRVGKAAGPHPSFARGRLNTKALCPRDAFFEAGDVLAPSSGTDVARALA
jgi:hypothetical protein